MRDEDVEEARLRKTRKRQEGKEAWDLKHNLRTRPFEIGDIVLRWDSVRETNISNAMKLDFRWLGPYQIGEANVEKGYFKLKELGNDGVHLKGTVSTNKLKLFYQQDR